jgi:putative ABC transport system ATP-binding protein
MGAITQGAALLPLESRQAAVAVRNVSYSYGEGATRRPVLSRVSLALAPGELAVLTGHSGAGKTTLLTLIGAIRALQQGSINVLGLELAGRDPAGQREVRRRIGFIFQDHNLFGALTVLQTLRLTTELTGTPLSRNEATARADEILGQLGMAAHLHALPRALSTGQKQRVAVARAMINRPRLILGDEPTASLDHASSMLVIDLIKRHLEQSSASALIVTHDERIVGLANRVLRLKDGVLVDGR